MTATAKGLTKRHAPQPRSVALRIDLYETGSYRRTEKDPVFQALLKVPAGKYGEFLQHLTALAGEFNEATPGELSFRAAAGCPVVAGLPRVTTRE
jgi:hypothetical protein